jgi:pyruvate dehydrogenase E1 component
MSKDKIVLPLDVDNEETQEWLSSMEGILESGGRDRAVFLMKQLSDLVHRSGLSLPFTANTAYINTIPVADQQAFPGNFHTELRIRSMIRWNAMAMVVSANKRSDGIGGHISTYASACTLYEIAFNHFFKGRTPAQLGDLVYFQGHASPGIYARAFLEGRISEEQMRNFRRELKPGSKVGGLPSYPHPKLLNDFWQFPTVSMGLGPIMAIYQARFMRYLENRKLVKTEDTKVWAFLGDGECDEPESLGAINLASREGLDNLIFVVNCNLQRLDGPVRGNAKIIQELEAGFRGAGWNVIKVIWGSEWDALLEKDVDGQLIQRMEDAVDGDFQKYSTSEGSYIRNHFFGASEELLKMVEHLSDEQLKRLGRGGHDPRKVYAAYKQAAVKNGRPTVILAKTIKGYGLGEAGEGKNTSHNQKKLNEKELIDFRTRFGIPLDDVDVLKMPLYKPAEDSKELEYMRQKRRELGGYLPKRMDESTALTLPETSFYERFEKGSAGREVSTTMGYVTFLQSIMGNKGIGKNIVPIVPDESRTFGMEGLFRMFGIYSSKGQIYEPVDKDILASYHEATDGQIIQEGLCEAGAMSSFIAAGCSHLTTGVPMVPFYIYYSMFGFQRVGDLIWAAMDMECRGFLIGAVAGRTTLNGEGLQHEDGHSHVLCSTVPGLVGYDPSYIYELTTIIRDGLKRMYSDGEKIFYHITVYNEAYEQPEMPKGVEEGIIKGMYKIVKSKSKSKIKAQLLGAGVLLKESIKAAKILEKDYGVSTDVWSVTSFTQLRSEALEIESRNMLHPEKAAEKNYIEQCLEKEKGVFVASSDYMRILPEGISKWVPGGLNCLGTDGCGRSSSREELRRYFNVDVAAIILQTVTALVEKGDLKKDIISKVIKDFEIDPDATSPLTV